jgi:hypothetical protein
MTSRTKRTLAIYTCIAMAAAFAAACSEDSPAKPAPGDGGGDAGSSTDGGGTGSDAGTGADSAFLPDTGPPDTGACTSTEPLFATGFQASCATCMGNKCCASVKACQDAPDCKAYAQCYSACRADGGTKDGCLGPCAAGKDPTTLKNTYNPLLLCGGNDCHFDGDAATPACPW